MQLRFRIGICGIVVVGLFVDAAVQAEPEASAWHRVTIPEAWREVPEGDLAPVDGYSWYRCLVRVPAAWEGDELTLCVEALDDARASYINGASVGATGTFPPRYRSGLGERGRYRVRPELVQYGELNAVALRVFQNDPRPNFHVAPPVLLNQAKRQAIRMAGPWQYRPGDNRAWSKASPPARTIDPAASSAKESSDRVVFGKVDEVTDVERYIAWRKSDNDPLPPREAERGFDVPDDLQFQLVLREPEIAQPLFMTWDQRGRLWLMEYRQYPNPAGLTMVSRDVYLRTVYDQVPPPPPHHFRGRDRISIHEDTDGDGVYDRHKVFVDGLNLATSLAHARGGVWVTNPPYLLFYPDRDGDDVPDGDPEVHLQGFGLEDSHSVINSLCVGPDGWLYAAQGSTVSARVSRPGSEEEPIRTVGQQIWRYHPELKRFEVFAEGGGNTFGVEIDSKGRIYSGNNGGDSRGFHYVQGGYYRKTFSKHGSLSNPYAFGYFQNMKHHRVPRFTHTFVIYEADVLPDRYHGRLFGIEPLQGQVVMSRIDPFQSSFQTKDLGRPVKTEDPWFRPVDIKVGPDGCIYVADMYEQRIDHSSHYAGRVDRTNGRVYRLRRKQTPDSVKFDYGSLSSDELVELLNHPSNWHRQTARRLLGDRRDPSLIPSLVERTKKAEGQLALELLWALQGSGGLTDDVAIDLLGHRDVFVRAWTVRLLCDRRQVAPQVARTLADVAAREQAIEVRKQLACSARRLPARDALPIIDLLLRYDADAQDIHQPLLLWWALESHTDVEGRDLILSTILAEPTSWQRPLLQDHLLERLMKRYALAGTRQDLLAAARLLSAAPDATRADPLMRGFEEAYQGRSLAGIPAELVQAISASGGGSAALRLRQGDPRMLQKAVTAVTGAEGGRAERLQYIEILGQIRRPEAIPALLHVVQDERDDGLVSAALVALQSFDDPRIGQQVLRELPRAKGDTRVVAESLLASRTGWAIQLLEAVEGGLLTPADVSETTLRKVLLHDDLRIRQLVSKHWGAVAGATTEQMRQEVDRVAAIVEAASGNPKKGKPLFMERCGKCHTLFGEGGMVGPDLTSFQRDDLPRVLLNVVNPSAEIREGFENHMVLTDDGRVVNGFLADQDNQVVVLRGVDGQNLIFRRDEIDQMRGIPRSVMPEDTLKGLSAGQLRDLFAYLRSSQPVNY